MSIRIIPPHLSVSSRKLVPILFIISVLIASCSPTPPVTEMPATQVPEVISTPSPATDILETFSSEAIGLCFAYPQGYTQLPYNDTVEIVAPALAGTDTRGMFWLEISDAYNRTAEVIADQEVTMAGGLDLDRSNLTLGGEPAVVLDGMPGQDLTRKVYAVHQEKLYILTFTPTRSADTEAGVQMETLYAAVTGSWTWSACK